MGKKINVAVLTNIIPTYREGFYDRLFNREDLNVTVYCQNRMPGMNLIPIHERYGERVKIVKYISAKNEKVAWQFLPWGEIINDYDVVFVGGNPRVLSDFLISSFLHFAGKNIVHWTMAHSFRANVISEMIRLMWSRIFENIFVYTDAEVEYLHKKGFKKKFILGMNNGLDQKNIDAVAAAWTKDRLKEWSASNNLENRTLMLSCARLDAKNRFELVVQSMPEIIALFPDLLWCLIGDGDDEVKLKTMVKNAGLSSHVRFIGGLYKEDELAPWFLSSEVFVHPAAIGLSLLHSFGYGLPVITHGKAELHNPEYAAFEPDSTGRNFCIGNPQSLADTVIKLLQDRALLSNMKKYVLKVAREKYNVDVMVERFVEIARKASAAGNRLQE